MPWIVGSTETFLSSWQALDPDARGMVMLAYAQLERDPTEDGAREDRTSVERTRRSIGFERS